MSGSEFVALCASIVTALATVVIGLFAHRLSRQSARSGAQRAIGALANAMVAIRLEHPAVQQGARKWTDASWDSVYTGTKDASTDTDINRHYAYVETGLEFCNATLEARAGKLISEPEFEGHYGRVVDLFLSENWPIVQHIWVNRSSPRAVATTSRSDRLTVGTGRTSTIGSRRTCHAPESRTQRHPGQLW